MNTIKSPLKYLQNKIKKEVIKILNYWNRDYKRLNIKLKKNKDQTRKRKREIRRGKLSSSKNTKYDLATLKLNKKLAIQGDSKNEIQNRLDVDKEKISKFQQNFQVIKRYGEINPIDFSHIKQEDKEININEFLDMAENNQTKYNRTPIIDVIIGSHRYNFPFILNGEYIINDSEPRAVNRLYRNSDELAKSIEKKSINTTRL